MKLFVNELSYFRLRRIEKQMRPGKLSIFGFLASSEKLVDIIREDSIRIQRLGITHKQIADRLDSIIGKAIRTRDLLIRNKETKIRKYNIPLSHWEAPGVTVENQFYVTGVEYMGFQECPFDVPKEKVCTGHLISCIWVAPFGTTQKGLILEW